MNTLAPSQEELSAEILRQLRGWLRRNVPHASAMILSVDADGAGATVRATVRMPSKWVGQVLSGRAPLNHAPLRPVELRRAGKKAVPGFLAVDWPPRLRRCNQWWLSLGAAAGIVNAMLVFTPDERDAWRADQRHLKNSLCMLQLLTMAQLPQHGGRTHPAINAKQQWEATVDVLPEIICLLDRDRRVLRINRTIERWDLGNVRDSIGLDLHVLLHPSCADAGCGLRAALDEGWVRAAGTGATSEIQLYDPRLNRTLGLSMRHLTSRPGFAGLDAAVRAVCLIADVTALRAAQQQLQSLNEQLEERVQARTEELTQANAELRKEIVRREVAESDLRESRNELSSLSVQLMHAQEIERKRISQELHDAVGQSLSAVKYTLERSVHLLEHPERGSLADALELAVSHVHRTINDVRAISTSLRPRLLDDLGPASALRAFCREWSDVYPNVEVVVDMPLRDADIPRSLGVSVFRIVQEALNNVAKHAAARSVKVSLGIRSGLLYAEVADDGVGFNIRAKSRLRRHGSGWRGMRERAEHDGGKLAIDSAPGRGTTLSVCWPLKRD